MLFLVIICSLVGGVFSLIGGILLAANKRRASLAEYASAFAAGALLAAAFIDLLPEALEEGGDAHFVLISALAGLVFFFILEGVLGWATKRRKISKNKSLDPVVPMIIIGDTIHNFVDGVAIAAAFLISPISGVIVTAAVAAHEIPQEIGDFGILIKKGISRNKTILINILSALATTVSAIIFYILGTDTEISFAPILAAVAGFFIYIAVRDIIPSIHSDESKGAILKKSILLLVGILLVGGIIIALHDVAH